MTAHSFEVGETVVDREDPRSPPAVVVSLPAKTAADWITYGGTTVAHDNPGYPADARLVVVVAVGDVDTYLSEWDAQTPLTRSDLDETGVYYRVIPVSRLTTVETNEDADSDTEVVTDPT